MMVRTFFLFMLVLLSACAGKRPRPDAVVKARCGPTPIMIADLKKLGLEVPEGKVIVARLLRVNCPACTEDLIRIGSLFQSGKWDKGRVHLVLIAYRKEGVEDRKTFDTFVRGPFMNTGIPPEAAEIVAVATAPPLAKRPAGETLISASCPAVVRLIQVRYPSLLDNVVPRPLSDGGGGPDRQSAAPAR
ncbi:MAG: hypothetical protein HC902_09590, partial [Calothrix sp. SM1_5_4]|nr:hypothetical protein [Calothrix sp. SM1_5_4]